MGRAGFSSVGIVAAALLVGQPPCAAAAATGYGFVINVTLSAKAAALLTAKKEAITVSAMYSGEPIPSKAGKADEEGMIDLGSEEVTIPGAAGRATITGKSIIAAHVGWVKTPQVLINVYSARRTSQDNLLDCGIFEDAVAVAQLKPIAIACKVIGEL